MISRNYQTILERISPVFYSQNKKLAMALLRALADELTELENKVCGLCDFYDLDQDLAGNLEKIGHLFGLDRNKERPEFFRDKLISAIFLAYSSGTYADVEALFNRIAGEGNWTLERIENAMLKARFKTSISKIKDNFVTNSRDNLISRPSEDNLVLYTRDPTFYLFLQAILPAGGGFNFSEQEGDNGRS